MIVAFALAFVLDGTPAAPAPSGSLCFQGSSQPCIATSGDAVEVTAADAPRDYVWSSADGKRIVFGTVAAKATAVRFGDGALRHVSLSLSGDRGRGWPVDTKLLLGGKTPRWAWTVPAAAISKLRDLAIPAERLGLTIVAPHHYDARRSLGSEGPVDLASIQLKPLPLVHGRVVRLEEGKKVEVAGANLLRDDGKIATSSGVNGAFSVEITQPIPNQLLVAAPGLATLVVPFSDPSNEPASDVDLGELVFDRGCSLTVTIERPASVEALKLRLLKEVERQYELAPIATRELGAKDAAATFDDLSSGKYVVVAEGTAPLERMSKTITLRDESVKETLTIAPFRLFGKARFGEDPLPNLKIDFTRRDWRAGLTTDESGEFDTVMWQPGEQYAGISGSDIGTVVVVKTPVLGADPTEWNIDIPKRLIDGRIIDAETKQPIPDVQVQARTTSGDQRGYFAVRPKEDGTFRIVAPRDGSYDIVVTHPQHIPETRSIEIGPDTPSQRLEILLQRGIETKLEFVTVGGLPMELVQVLEGVARDGHNPDRLFTADVHGRLTVRTAPGQQRTLYAIEYAGGSFTTVHIDARSKPSDVPVRVVMPPAEGSLVVETVDANEQPVPAATLMRFNGEWLPFPVVARIGARFVTNGVVRFPKLPAGSYELWAVRATRDYTGPLNQPSVPPVRIGVTAGEQKVRLTVAN